MWSSDYDGKPAKPGKAKAKWPVLPLLHISSGGDLPDTVMKIRNMGDQARLTTLYTEESVKFIRNHKHSPFFLYLAHNMPHGPLAVRSEERSAGTEGGRTCRCRWST